MYAPSVCIGRLNRTIFLAAIAFALVSSTSGTWAAISPETRTGLPVDAQVSSAAVKQFLVDAQKALKAGNPRLAVILMKNAVNAEPKNAMIRAQLGLVLLESGDLASAERELRQARADGAPEQFVLQALFQTMLTRHEVQKLLEEFPDPGPIANGPTVPDVLKARALALQSLGRNADAAAAMDHALALRRDIPTLLSRARLAERQGNMSLAKSLDDEALKIDSSNGDALLFKLGILMLSNDNAGALALSDQIVHRFPASLPAHLARIEIFLTLKQDNKAKIEVDAILARSPSAAIAQYYKALLLARANDVKGAWRIAQSLPPELAQSQPSIAIMISQMAIGTGNIETAASILSGALAKLPDNSELRLRLAAVRMQQNSLEAALNVLQPLKDSSDPRTLALLSQVYLKLGRYNDALGALNRLNTAGGGTPGVKRELALVELQTGQSDQGLKDLIELAAKQPTDPTIVAPLVAALIQARRFPDALAAAERLGADPKQRVQSLLLRGQILVRKDDTNEALAAFQSALQLERKNVAALYYRASVFESVRRYPEAVRDLQTIVAIDPKNVSAIVKMAEIAARQNQDTNVRTLLTRAIALSPQDPAPRIALARYLTARGELKNALATGLELIKVHPNNGEALAIVGGLQLSLGQKAQAIATFRKLTSVETGSATAQLLLANALFSAGDRAGASTALDMASSAEPNSVQVRAAQINLLVAIGDVKGAVVSARAFQTNNPGTTSDLLVADTYVQAKEFSQAAAVLTKSLAERPNSAVLIGLAQIAASTGDTKRAQDLMSNWLNTNPRDLSVRTQYATRLMQDGENKNAVAQFEIVLRQDPNNVTSLNNLGWILQKDDPKRALVLVSKAYRASPNSPEVADTFGWLKYLAKDAKGAVELLKHAHDLRPKDGEITYHLVLALDASGNRGAAKGLLAALLNSGIKFAHVVDAMKLAEAWR